MGFLSFFPSRRALLAPILCVSLALPVTQTLAQSASEASGSSSSSTKKKSTTTTKQTSKPAQKSTTSRTSKQTRKGKKVIERGTFLSVWLILIARNQLWLRCFQAPSPKKQRVLLYITQTTLDARLASILMLSANSQSPTSLS